MRSLRRREALMLLSCAAAGGARAAPARITVASYPDLDRALKLALPAFARRHPGVAVNVVTLSHKDHHTAMTTALAAGAALPDLIALDMDFMGKFVDSAGLEDLSRAPYLAAGQASRFPAYAWRAGVNRRGEIKALPVDTGPGALFKALSVFALRDIDLTKLESRPARGRPWEYFFYADIVSARDDVRCGRAIVHLAEFARWVKTLGSYPRWDAQAEQRAQIAAS